MSERERKARVFPHSTDWFWILFYGGMAVLVQNVLFGLILVALLALVLLIRRWDRLITARREDDYDAFVEKMDKLLEQATKQSEEKEDGGNKSRRTEGSSKEQS